MVSTVDHLYQQLCTQIFKTLFRTVNLFRLGKYQYIRYPVYPHLFHIAVEFSQSQFFMLDVTILYYIPQDFVPVLFIICLQMLATYARALQKFNFCITTLKCDGGFNIDHVRIIKCWDYWNLD